MSWIFKNLAAMSSRNDKIITPVVIHCYQSSSAESKPRLNLSFFIISKSLRCLYMDDAQLAQFDRRLFLDLAQLEQDRAAFHKPAQL